MTKFEIADLCKGVHCVDLNESFQTHIYLQNLASIQLITSPVKFARSSDAARCREAETVMLGEEAEELRRRPVVPARRSARDAQIEQ